MRSRSYRVAEFLLVAILLFSLLAGCAPATPQIVEVVKEVPVEKVVKETVVVEKEVAIEKKVVETVVVEKEKVVEKQVEVVVTATPVPTKAISDEPVKGGTLTAALGSVPPTLDSMSTSNSATSAITNMIEETLVAFGEDFRIIPMLAESWDISEDGKVYTFHLRQGVKFHNGKEMTSDDVMASMKRFLEVTARASSFKIMEAYEAPDAYTFVTKLTAASAGWLGVLGSPSSSLMIKPKESIEGKAAGKLVVPDDIIGTGPYMLTEFVPDQYAVLKRFEDYVPLPGERDGLGGAKIAYFDEVRIEFVTDSSARLAGLEAGTYDWMSGPSVSDMASIDANPETEMVIIHPANGGYILFNHSPKAGWSSNLDFRQAVLAALDMEALGMAFNAGHRELFELNASLWPKETFWYTPDAYADSQYNQKNPDKAKELLAKAGYAGEEIVIASYNIEEYVRIMLALQAQLGAVGIKAKLELYDWPGIFAKWPEETGWNISFTQNNTFQLLDPSAASVMFTSTSTHPILGKYNNPDMDAVFDKLSKAATLEEYKADLLPMQTIFWQTLPNIKTGDNHILEAIRSDIKGYRGFGRAGTYRFYGVWRQAQ